MAAVSSEEGGGALEIVEAQNKAENFDDIAAMEICYACGYDREKRRLVVFLPGQIPPKSSQEFFSRLLRYMLHILAPVVEEQYAIIYVHDKRANTSVDIGWFKKAHAMLPRNFKKNMKKMYVVEPSTTLKILMWVLEHLVTKKFWDKVKYLSSLEELYECVEKSEIRFPSSLEERVLNAAVEQPLKCGFLLKQTNPKRGIRQWKCRYCVLSSFTLSYYLKTEKPGHGNARGSIGLKGAQIELSNKRVGAFCLTDIGGDKYFFASDAPTDAEKINDCGQWHRALQEALLGDPKCFAKALESFQSEGHSIPPLVEVACNFIEENGLYSEGLFRVPGSLTDLKALKLKFDQSGVVEFDANTDVHVVAGLLKLFFRELPEPVTTFALYSDFIRIFDRSDNDEERLYNLLPLIARLPPINKNTLDRLFSLLIKVVENQSVNKMGISNVATVIAPNLFRQLENDPIRDALLMVQNMPCFVKIFELLLRHKQSSESATDAEGSSRNIVVSPEALRHTIGPMSKGGQSTLPADIFSTDEPSAFDEISRRPSSQPQKRGGIRALSKKEGEGEMLANWRVIMRFQAAVPEAGRKNIEDEMRVLDNPNSATAWLILGEKCLNLGYYEAAREALTQSVTLEPQNAFSHFCLGQVAEKQDDIRGAQFAYEQCLVIDPINMSATAALKALLAADFVMRRSRSLSRGHYSAPRSNDLAASLGGGPHESNSSSEDEDASGANSTPTASEDARAPDRKYQITSPSIEREISSPVLIEWADAEEK